MKLKALVISAFVALGALSFSQSAFAYSCYTSCYGNGCWTNCY